MTANTGELDERRPGRIPADTLSNRITLARKLDGVTIKEAVQQVLARTGVKLSESSWANWETGMRPQRETDVIQAIAEGLDVDQHWLMFGGELAGPRGREIKRVTKRPTSDTVWNPTSAVRSSSTRPRAGRPNRRGDSTSPGIVRPVVIDHSLSGIGNRVANAE